MGLSRSTGESGKTSKECLAFTQRILFQEDEPREFEVWQSKDES